MSTSYEAVNVRCPFYKSDEALRIKCEGLEDSSRLAVEFQKKAEKEQWQWRYCNTEWEQCKVCQIIEGKYK